MIVQNEESLGKTDEKYQVDDAKSKNIIEQHLIDHEHEWTGKAKSHNKK